MPTEQYPAMPTGSRSSASSEPVTNQDKKLSSDHKSDALTYNMQHARDHLKVAEGVEASLGDEHGEKYPEYGFYGPRGDFSTVTDEGELDNKTNGFSQMDGRYFRSNNPTVLGYDGFEETDSAVEKFGQTGDE